MATLVVGVVAGIIHGTHVAQFLEHHVAPLLVGVVLAKAEEVAARIELGRRYAEVVAQAVGGIVADGSRESDPVLHNSHHAHRMRQVGHSLGLGLGIVAHGIGVAHVGPVEVTSREIEGILSTRGVAVGHLQRDGAMTRRRILMIVQYLSRSRCHASHDAVARIAFVVEQQRTGIVERLLLSPFGREQRMHLGLALRQVGFRHLGLHVVLHIIGRSLLHGHQPPVEALGQLSVAVALVRIAHNSRQQVVIGDHRKAAVLIAHDTQVTQLGHLHQLSTT